VRRVRMAKVSDVAALGGVRCIVPGCRKRLPEMACNRGAALAGAFAWGRRCRRADARASWAGPTRTCNRFAAQGKVAAEDKTALCC